MQTLAPASVAPTTDPYADRARRNLRANRTALDRAGNGPLPVSEADRQADRAFLPGRDGYLTHRSAAGWAAGCSLPLRAAAQQLRTMDVSGPTACFLDPPHAAHLRVALGRLSASQAVVAVVLDPAALPVLLGCDDFSADVAAHRLWVVAGADWAQQLNVLFGRHAGLPTPSQFVRLNLPDASRLDPVIAEAQRVFAGVTADRTARAEAVRSAWRPPAAPRLCVVTGRQFRLWADAGLALADGVADAVAGSKNGCDLEPTNPDDPLSGSTLAMLESAAACGALLTADFARADVPDLLPRDLPWATWVTTPRVPAVSAAGPNDRLVVADPAWGDAAVAVGWPAGRVRVGGWPAVLPAATPEDDITAEPSPVEPHVALIADTVSLDPPDRLDEFSSHRLLWGAIRQELHDDPWAAGTDPAAYLRSRQKRFDVQDASLDRALFVNQLITPAVAQGVARRLIADGVPLRLHGAGWAAIPEFAARAAGPIASRGQLARAARQAAALIDARPANWRNGTAALGQPVIRCGGRTAQAVRHDVNLALAGRLPAEPPVPAISPAAVLDWLTARP